MVEREDDQRVHRRRRRRGWRHEPQSERQRCLLKAPGQRCGLPVVSTAEEVVVLATAMAKCGSTARWLWVVTWCWLLRDLLLWT